MSPNTSPSALPALFFSKPASATPSPYRAQRYSCCLSSQKNVSAPSASISLEMSERDCDDIAATAKFLNVCDCLIARIKSKPLIMGIFRSVITISYCSSVFSRSFNFSSASSPLCASSISHSCFVCSIASRTKCEYGTLSSTNSTLILLVACNILRLSSFLCPYYGSLKVCVFPHLKCIYPITIHSFFSPPVFRSACPPPASCLHARNAVQSSARSFPCS